MVAVALAIMGVGLLVLVAGLVLIVARYSDAGTGSVPAPWGGVVTLSAGTGFMVFAAGVFIFVLPLFIPPMLKALSTTQLSWSPARQTATASAASNTSPPAPAPRPAPPSAVPPTAPTGAANATPTATAPAPAPAPTVSAPPDTVPTPQPVPKPAPPPVQPAAWCNAAQTVRVYLSPKKTNLTPELRESLSDRLAGLGCKFDVQMGTTTLEANAPANVIFKRGPVPYRHQQALLKALLELKVKIEGVCDSTITSQPEHTLVVSSAARLHDRPEYVYSAKDMKALIAAPTVDAFKAIRAQHPCFAQ